MSDKQLPSTCIPRIIGLTGGLGMGKTTVSNHLNHRYQLPVLDADIYAREAVEPGSTVLQEIVERYGSYVLQPNEQLDRLRLAEIIFNSPPERLWLEQRIHPFVRDRITSQLQELAEQSCSTAVVVVPLLFEARMTDLVTEIWVVHCPLETQIERIKQRDHLDLDRIRSRINSQMPIERKLQQADVILDNTSTAEELLKQVDTALQTPPTRKVFSQRNDRPRHS